MLVPLPIWRIFWISELNKKLKILVVDDSAFMRLLLTDILSEDESLEVVGSAENGKEAVKKVVELDPDVVMLDMNMGEYDGTYAVREIMSTKPKPILILSAVGNSNLEPIFDALRHGAVDYINKPVRGGSKMRGMETELRNKIKSIGGVEPVVIRGKMTDEGYFMTVGYFNDDKKLITKVIEAGYIR